MGMGMGHGSYEFSLLKIAVLGMYVCVCLMFQVKKVCAVTRIRNSGSGIVYKDRVWDGS